MAVVFVMVMVDALGVQTLSMICAVSPTQVCAYLGIKCLTIKKVQH